MEEKISDIEKNNFEITQLEKNKEKIKMSPESLNNLWDSI